MMPLIPAMITVEFFATNSFLSLFCVCHRDACLRVSLLVGVGGVRKKIAISEKRLSRQ